MILSVIIPVYNGEKYLEKCIRSVLCALPKGGEIIVANDGSTDGTAQVLCGFSDARIKVLNLPHKGVSGARNAALKETRGKWISFVDADDEVKKGIFETLLKEADEDTEFVCCSREKVYSGGQTFKAITSMGEDKKILTGEKDIYREIFYDNFGSAVWGRLFKKEIIDRYSLRFREDMVILEDMCFIADYVLRMEKRAVFLSDRLYIYTIQAQTPVKKGQIKDLKKGYGHIIRLGYSISPKTGQLMELTYTDRLSRAVAKLPLIGKSEDEKELIRQYRHYSKKAIVSHETGAFRKVYYFALGAFPNLSGIILKAAISIMRRCKRTVD